jgi:hypothetical protein
MTPGAEAGASFAIGREVRQRVDGMDHGCVAARAGTATKVPRFPMDEQGVNPAGDQFGK